MTFTLRDPRLEAFSNVGGNLGKSLGDEIISMVENRRFNKSLEGADPNNLLGMLQGFAKNRVSPEMQERFFSPVIQNRLSQQKMASILEPLLGKQDLTGRDIASALIQASAYSPNGLDLKGLSELLRSGQYGNIYKKFANEGGFPSSQGTMTSPQGAPVINDQGNFQEQQTPFGGQIKRQPPTTFLSDFPRVEQGDISDERGRGIVPKKPITQPYTESEQLNLLGELNQAFTDPNAAVNAFNTINNARNSQIAAERAQIADEQTFFDKVENKQDKLRGEVDQFLSRDFPDSYQKTPGDVAGTQIVSPRAGVPTFISDMTKDLLVKETGKKGGILEKRYNEFKSKVLTPLIDEFRFIRESLEGNPIFSSHDSEANQKWLEEANLHSNRILSATPKEYRPQAADALRTTFRNNFSGVGPVEAEFAIYPPNPAFIEKIKTTLGKSPSQYASNPRSSAGFSTNPNFEKSQKIAAKRLVPLIEEGAKNNTSPLIMHDIVIGLGYTDEVFKSALREAEKKGVKFSDEMQTALKDSSKDFKWTLPAAIRGNTLRKFGEISR